MKCHKLRFLTWNVKEYPIAVHDWSLAEAERFHEKRMPDYGEDPTGLAYGDWWVIEAEEIVMALAPIKSYPTFWCDYAFAPAWEQNAAYSRGDLIRYRNEIVRIEGRGER